MIIREASPTDFDLIWPILKRILASGETYSIARDSSKEQGQNFWMTLPRQTYLLEAEGQVLGSYYIKTNQAGPGAHICNCGYIVSPQAQGRGIATQMCTHSIKIARSMAYKAMQFNAVVSTNVGAIHLWKKLGFEVVGQIPKAFDHPKKGYVDSLVMYQWLQQS